jgi:hypothetical protein
VILILKRKDVYDSGNDGDESSESEHDDNDKSKDDSNKGEENDNKKNNDDSNNYDRVTEERKQLLTINLFSNIKAEEKREMDLK